MEQLVATVLAACTLSSVFGEFLPDIERTVEAELGEPKPSNDYNSTCMGTWKETGVFWFWLVRIMYQDPATEVAGARRRDIGTGSIITSRHVLTACHPVWTVGVRGGDPNNVHVFSFVIQLSTHKPNEVNKEYPWAAAQDGCILEWYTALKGYYPKGRCAQNGNIPFQDLTDNFLILALAQEVSFPAWNQWLTMPFERTLHGSLQSLRWFQRNRKTRCQVPRWGVTNQLIIFPPTDVQQTGYTYRAMEWTQECAPLLCSDFCAKNILKECVTDCQRKEAPRWHGKILCLKRMREGKQSETKEKFYHSYDFEGVDKDYERAPPFNQPPTKQPSEACTKESGYASSLYGAPVVCLDTVVAIVTMCRPSYLAATPITSIRHHIFKLFPEEFSKVALYMDGSNETLSPTPPKAEDDY